jgi:hypothetical protein
MIIYLDRKAPPLIRTSLFSRLRSGALFLRKKLSGAGGAALVQQNLLKELALQKDFFWVATEGGRPTKGPVDIAWVISSRFDLKMAIRLKEEGFVRTLWAGPNIITVPLERKGIIAAPAIDRCIVPCEWVQDLYIAQAPTLRGRTFIWPVGIDAEYWSPSTEAKEYLLIYNKMSTETSESLCHQLEKMGCAFRVMHYGDYRMEDYRTLLRRAWGMVWLSQSESEGLAVMEAMSMNVPVLAWNPGQGTYRSPELRQTFSFPASSIPYFEETCGLIFRHIEDFSDRFQKFRGQSRAYQPRQYLLRNHLTLSTNLSRSPLSEFISMPS